MATNQSLDLLTAKTTPTTSDVLYILDVADVTQSAAGSSKSLTIGNLATMLASNTKTLTNTTFDTAGTGNVFKINGTAISAITGSGAVVLANTPTLITPVLGVATATSINGLTITSSTGVLTVANGKTLTVNKSLTFAGNDGKTLTINNSLVLAGTDSTTMTFPSTSATIARTDGAQTFTGIQTFSQVLTTNNAIAASSSTATVPVTSKINTVTNDAAGTLTITMTTTNAIDGQISIVRILDHSAVAQTLSWVNTENSQIIIPTTSNGSTTLPLTVGLMFNSATTKWRCLAVE